VGHQHNLIKLEVLHHGVEIPHLIGCRIGVPGGFLRGAPAKKIKGDDTAWGSEARNETIIEMPVIGKAMNQDKGRLLPSELDSHKMIGTTLHDMGGAGAGVLLLWLGGGLSHSAVPPGGKCSTDELCSGLGPSSLTALSDVALIFPFSSSSSRPPDERRLLPHLIELNRGTVFRNDVSHVVLLSQYLRFYLQAGTVDSQ
jgi:hypothetical protein